MSIAAFRHKTQNILPAVRAFNASETREKPRELSRLWKIGFHNSAEPINLRARVQGDVCCGIGLGMLLAILKIFVY